MASGIIVDTDSHLLEPPDIWEKNIDPRFKDRALRISIDEHGVEYLNVDGIKSGGYSGGVLGRVGGLGKSLEWKNSHGTIPYWEAAQEIPEAIDPHERIKFLDKERIDATLFYPTLGLGWENECTDPALSAAYCRVYTDWLFDFCQPYPDRLIPIAHVSVRDVNEGVKELQRVAAKGLRGAFICPAPVNGIPYGDSYYDPFWAMAEETGLPITLHVIFNPYYIGKHFYKDWDSLGPEYFVEMMVHGDPFLSFTHMMTEGVFERFPNLKLTIVEIGATWIMHWLDILDFKFDAFGSETCLRLKPSEYFDRQVWISAEPAERGLWAAAQVVGAHKFMWGSDHPHPEGHLDPVRKVRGHIAPLPEADQRKILGENTANLYGIKVPVRG